MQSKHRSRSVSVARHELPLCWRALQTLCIKALCNRSSRSGFGGLCPSHRTQASASSSLWEFRFLGKKKKKNIPLGWLQQHGRVSGSNVHHRPAALMLVRLSLTRRTRRSVHIQETLVDFSHRLLWPCPFVPLVIHAVFISMPRAALSLGGEAL